MKNQKIYDLPSYTPFVDRMLARYYAGKEPKGPAERANNASVEVIVETLSPAEIEFLHEIYNPPREKVTERIHSYQYRHPEKTLPEWWRVLWNIQKKIARERGLID